MSKTSGKWEIRTVDILVVIIMVLTGSTSLLAWGSKGFTDWNVMGWFGYAPEQTPAPLPEEPQDEELQAVASGYNLVMPAVTSRAISSEAEAEFNEYISRSGTDETTDAFLAKVTVKNELDGETLSGKAAGAKFIYAQSAMAFAIMLPREIPFVHLQTGNIYKDTKCEYKGSSLNNFYKNAFDYWDMYVLTSGGKPTASTLGAITVTYQIAKEIHLPPDPVKEGYTFTGWYYGTESEHGENCTAYDGEPITEETSLHAHFEINRYTVTYDTAGGNEMANQVVNWNTSLTPPTPERTGYDFKGWYLSDDTEYTGQAIKEDTTLKAKWEIKKLTVNFSAFGESCGTRETIYGTIVPTIPGIKNVIYTLQSRITKTTGTHGKSGFADKEYGDFKYTLNVEMLSSPLGIVYFYDVERISDTEQYALMCIGRHYLNRPLRFEIYKSQKMPGAGGSVSEHITPLSSVEFPDINNTDVSTYKIEITSTQIKFSLVLKTGETTSKEFASDTEEYAVFYGYLNTDNVYRKENADSDDDYDITETIELYDVEELAEIYPTKEGLTFAGWYYDEELTRPYNLEPVHSDINLYAKYVDSEYTVTYDVAGGEHIPEQIVIWNTVLTPPTPKRTGYDFKGWFLADGTEYTGQAIKEDTTLTARWEIKVFTVTFYVDGEVYATQEVEYGTTFAELAEQAKDLNLKVLTVMTEQGELPLDEYANIRITENYSVTSTSLTATEQVQHFFKVYPWVFVVAGAGLSAMILIIDAVRHRPAKQQTTRKRR